MKLYKYTVSGKTYFPLDMLRYDSCWPQTSEDVDEIQMCSDSDRRAVPSQEQTVHLIGIQPPTDDRWVSFGWHVAAPVVTKRVAQP